MSWTWKPYGICEVCRCLPIHSLSVIRAWRTWSRLYLGRGASPCLASPGAVSLTADAWPWRSPPGSTPSPGSPTGCVLPWDTSQYTVEPCYYEALGAMKITLLYQVSCYIRVKKKRNIKSWDQQNYLVIRGLCYISELFYNELPLYYIIIHHKSYTKWLIEGAIWTV